MPLLFDKYYKNNSKFVSSGKAKGIFIHIFNAKAIIFIHIIISNIELAKSIKIRDEAFQKFYQAFGGTHKFQNVQK